MINEAHSLMEQLKHFDEAYFERGERLISDDAYDQLWFRMKELLEDPKVAKALSRDTMPLGTHSITGQKIAHPVAVLSLDKLKIDDPKFTKKLEKFAEKTKSDRFLVQHKLDGLSIVVYRHAGEPVFVTRGGGNAGENVTKQFKNIESIWSAAMKMREGEAIRGEAIIPRDSSSNRSKVSGFVRSKDDTTAAKNDVHFVCYELLDARRYTLSEPEKLAYIESLGFETVESTELMSAEDVSNYLLTEGTKPDIRDQRYEIDGLVLKPEYEPNGKPNGHHQFGQLAIKLIPLSSITKMKDIEWNVGKNGRLTPVALFETVSIGGASYSRASLGSWSIVKDLGITTESTIEVSIMNDVIPKVTSVLDHRGRAEQPRDTVEKGNHLFMTNYALSLAEKMSLANSVFEWALTGAVIEKIIESNVIDKLSDVLLRTEVLSDVLTKNQFEKLSISIEKSLREKWNVAHVLMVYGVDGFGAETTKKFEGIVEFSDIDHSLMTSQQKESFSSFVDSDDAKDAQILAHELI